MREPELLKAFGTAWGQVTNAATLLPGGLHETKADADNIAEDKMLSDYGLITVSENGLARNTNGGPIREHQVKIEVHTVNGLSSLATVVEAMASTSSGIPSKIPTHTALDNGGYLIDLFPSQAPPGGQTPSRRAGKTVSKVAIAWRVQSRWPY